MKRDSRVHGRADGAPAESTRHEMNARGDEGRRRAASGRLKWAAVGLLGLALIAGPGTAAAQEELVVANESSVRVYARTAGGNTVPLRILEGSATGLSRPEGVALDLVHDELVVANVNGNSVTVYARTASGNIPPLRTLQGSATGLGAPFGVALDLVHDELVVANWLNNSITAYTRTSNGNIPPLRTVSGAATTLDTPVGVTLDVDHDELVVANFGGSSAVYSVTVYARTASGNMTPLRRLSGATTGLNQPAGVAVDLVHDELVVVNFGGHSVTIYARTASGNMAPLRTLSGASTGLWGPAGVALDLVHDELLVGNEWGNSVTVYPRTASGNTAPLRTLAGPSTGLTNSTFLTLSTSERGKFFTLTPCRVADTRNPASPSGGPALAANTSRSFPAVGLCGIPADARAIAINVTVVGETDVGDLRLYPTGGPVPGTSTINFLANEPLANNAIMALGTGGRISVQCDMPTGTTHFLFDVHGYFK